MQIKLITAEKAKYGGYQKPIDHAASLKGAIIVNNDPKIYRAHIIVIIFGRCVSSDSLLDFNRPS